MAEPGKGRRASTRLARGVAVTVLILIAACGGGSSDESGVEAAFLEHDQFEQDGQWGRLYDRLHPAHQELVDREDFMRCAQLEGTAPGYTVKVVETFEEPVEVEGEGEVESVAITAEYRDGTETQRHTSHLVDVGDGDWRWLLNDISRYQDC